MRTMPVDEDNEVKGCEYVMCCGWDTERTVDMQHPTSQRNHSTDSALSSSILFDAEEWYTSGTQPILRVERYFSRGW